MSGISQSGNPLGPSGGGGGGGGGGGIPDAPSDGSTYGRKDAAWVAIATSSPPQYDNTIYASTTGSAGASGFSPGEATTLASALSSATAGTLIVLASGTYSDADGPAMGTLTVPANDITIVGRSQGVARDTVALNDSVQLGSSFSGFRAYGLRFNNDIVDNGSGGRHQFIQCTSSSGVTYARTSPAQWIDIVDCDMNGMSMTISGAGSGGIGGGGDTFMSGSTSFGSIANTSTTVHRVELSSHCFTGKLSSTTFCLFEISGARATDSGGDVAVDAPTSWLWGRRADFMSSTAEPAEVNVALGYFDDCAFDRSSSTIGGVAPGNGLSVFSIIDYDNAVSGLVASDVKSAIDELAARALASTPSVVWGNNGVTIGANTRYLDYSFEARNAQAVNVEVPSGTGVATRIVVSQVGAGNGEDIVYTLTKNGSPTTLTVTVPSTGSGGTSTGSVSFDGSTDSWGIQVVKPLGILVSPADVRVAVQLEGE